MKKSFTILSAILITLFFSFKANAQDEETQAKSYMAFLGGLSFPQGNFGSSVYSNNQAGFAKKGPTLSLDFGIYLYKNFAIGINFAYQDQGELSDVDAQNLATGYLNSYIKDESNVTSQGRYQNIDLMVGPQYSFLYKKFTFDARIDAGPLKNISTPTYGVVFDNSSNSQTYLTQLNSQSLAFAYGGSLGVRYALSDSWDIGLRANYIDCSGIKMQTTGPFTTQGRWDTKQPITELQTTLGITLKF